MRPFCHLVFLLPTVLLLINACVPLETVPGGGPSGQPTPVSSFPDIDPGGTEHKSLHFTIRANTEKDARELAHLAEMIYTRIGSDTGLYASMSSENFLIVVYKDRDDYLSKTRLPSWSRAVAVGRSIYTYPGPDLEPMLAHEMSHLVFNNYMGRFATTYRWLNEGLAMVIELSYTPDSSKARYVSEKNENLRQNRMSFTQMTFFTPLTEERRMIDTWYMQVESVTAFMLNQASRLNFANFLSSLRGGVDVDQAIAGNYPGRFRSLNELEESWRVSI